MVCPSFLTFLTLSKESRIGSHDAAILRYDRRHPHHPCSEDTEKGYSHKGNLCKNEAVSKVDKWS